MSAPATAVQLNGWQRLRSPLAYLVLATGLLATLPGTALVGVSAAVLAILLGWRELNPVARALLGIGTASALLAVPIAPELLARAADNMIGLAALVISVMLFANLLTGSRDLATICHRLFTGRPLPRYLSITFGTGFLAIPLNFGAVGVLGGMLQHELQRSGDHESTRNAARAVLRGFGSASFFSPLSVAVAITLTFLPGLAAVELLTATLPLALAYLLLGLLFRQHEFGPPKAAPDNSGDGQHATALLRVAAYIAAVSSGVLALHHYVGLGYTHAVALACTIAVAAGLLVRSLRTGKPPALPSLAATGNELAIMGGSAFLGVLASGLALGLLGSDFGLPGWSLPLAALVVPWILFGGGILGLNPIVTGTLVGGVLAPIWPSSAMLALGISMLSGWGITVAGTPYSAAALILSRLTGYDNVAVALRWNLPMSITALLSGGALSAALTYWLA